MDTYSELEHKVLLCFTGNKEITTRTISDQSELPIRQVFTQLLALRQKGLLESNNSKKLIYSITHAGIIRLKSLDRQKKLIDQKQNAVKPRQINIYKQPCLTLINTYQRNDGNISYPSRYHHVS